MDTRKTATRPLGENWREASGDSGRASAPSTEQHEAPREDEAALCEEAARDMPCAIGAIDVGGTKIACAIVRYSQPSRPPEIEGAFSVPTNPRRGGKAVLDTVIAAAARLLEESEGPLAGIGVGAAGVVEPRDGSIAYANDIMPGWAGQPLASQLGSELGVDVRVLGDVQAHALGEARWGAARGASSCLCVGVGTGLGGAFVLNGQVVRGFRGAAGHLGHTLHPAAAHSACACGATAHVETVASGTAISAAYQGRAFCDTLDPALMGDEVARRAGDGEPRALEVLTHAGFALGEAIGSWCNLLDPELVVLSGSVTAAGAAWREAVEAGFARQALAPLRDIPLLDALLGSSAPLVGAAEHFRGGTVRVVG